VNIFEGARRIAKLTAALIVVGFVVTFFQDYLPPVSVSYLIRGATKPPVRVEHCEIGDISQTKEIITKSGAAVNANLCFRSPYPGVEDSRKIEQARKEGVSDSQIAEYFLIKSTDKLLYEEWVAAGMPATKDQVKPNASTYKLDDFIAAFQIPKVDEGYITRLVWLQRAQSLGLGFLQMLVTLAGFWLFVWAVGWIVRGFKGIPQGKDRIE
jgi:hypothetical protein